MSLSGRSQSLVTIMKIPENAFVGGIMLYLLWTPFVKRWNLNNLCESVFKYRICQLCMCKPTQVGESRCLRVKYEQLVLHPRCSKRQKNMQKKGLTIHSKSWLRWLPESADNLKFSAERLSENAQTINSVVTKRLRGVKPSLPFLASQDALEVMRVTD